MKKTTDEIVCEGENIVTSYRFNMTAQELYEAIDDYLKKRGEKPPASFKPDYPCSLNVKYTRLET